MKLLSFFMLITIFSVVIYLFVDAVVAITEKRVVGGYEENDPAVIEWQALILRNGTYIYISLRYVPLPY